MSAIPKEVVDALKVYLRGTADEEFPEGYLDTVTRMLLDICPFFFNPSEVPPELMPVLVPSDATLLILRQKQGSVEIVTSLNEDHQHNHRIAMLIEMVRHFSSAQPQSSSTLN
jgi:hypothetical protein